MGSNDSQHSVSAESKQQTRRQPSKHERCGGGDWCPQKQPEAFDQAPGNEG